MPTQPDPPDHHRIQAVAAPTPRVAQRIRDTQSGEVWETYQVWDNGHLTVKRPLRHGEAPGQHAHVLAGDVFKGITPEGWVVGWTTGRLELL